MLDGSQTSLSWFHSITCKEGALTPTKSTYQKDTLGMGVPSRFYFLVHFVFSCFVIYTLTHMLYQTQKALKVYSTFREKSVSFSPSHTDSFPRHPLVLDTLSVLLDSVSAYSASADIYIVFLFIHK